MDELFGILGDSPNAESLKDIIRSSFTGDRTYGEATQAFVMQLFAEQGLLAIGMDEPALKKLFAPLIEEEIFEQPSKALVDATKEQLEQAGFSGQAHAREINFFYLNPGRRDRIILEIPGHYQIQDTDLTFSESELRQEISDHPERFSPNVVMRPLYQETILPNLAYIGGGGELAYWLERKSQFEHFNTPFPMLIRRNSVLWIDKGSYKRMQKLGLEVSDLFLEQEQLVKKFVRETTEEELSLGREKKNLQELFEAVLTKTAEIDKSLVGTVEAERARQMKGLTNIEQRLMKAEKQRHEIEINQLRKLQDKLFPNRSLQERTENFMGIYLRQGASMIDSIVEALDPMEKEFLVLIEE